MSESTHAEEAVLKSDPPPNSASSSESKCVELNHTSSTHWWNFLSWHIPGIVSVTVSAILLWLNFSEYTIGGELGHSEQDSANAIGALQLAIKVHELFIIASLAIIARQLILESLTRDGIVLGLLGAESAMAQPSFVISGGYRQALAFGFQIIFHKRSIDRRGWPVRWRVLGLSFFFLLACILSSLAGPASAVLMLPRVDWKFVDEKTFTPPNSTFPNIMVGTNQVHGTDGSSPLVFETGSTYTPGLGYFSYFVENSAWNKSSDDLYHKFGDAGAIAYINTTGSYHRNLSAEWPGGTNIECGMQYDSYWTMDDLRGALDLVKIGTGWRSTRATMNLVALKAVTTCRAREKIPCPPASIIPSNISDPNWCYMSVNNHSATSGVIRRGQNLLLAAEYGLYDLRVWITEGPHSTRNTHYSDSIEVIFEVRSISDEVYLTEPSGDFDLIVCSFSGALVAGIGSSFGTRSVFEKIEYFNYSIQSDGKMAGPREFLFHENWLDRAYAIGGELWKNESYKSSDPFNYPPRPRTTAPQANNNVLGTFGNNTRDALSAVAEWDALSAVAEWDALPWEVAVGGSLAYLLSWAPTGDSQFVMPYDEIPPEFTAGLGPPTHWPTTYKYSVYREGYMFKRSTRTGILGMVVLTMHAVIVIVASLWQLLVVRRIILGWDGIPQYTMLGAGSPSLIGAYQILSADIEGDALRTVITLQEPASDCNWCGRSQGGLVMQIQDRTSYAEPAIPLVSVSIVPQDQGQEGVSGDVGSMEVI